MFDEATSSITVNIPKYNLSLPQDTPNNINITYIYSNAYLKLVQEAQIGDGTKVDISIGALLLDNSNYIVDFSSYRFAENSNGTILFGYVEFDISPVPPMPIIKK